MDCTMSSFKHELYIFRCLKRIQQEKEAQVVPTFKESDF